LLASCVGFSQDSLRSGLSQDSSIRATLVQGGRYPNLVYSANGQVLDRQEIIARLRLYDEAADELQSSRDARAGMVVWLGVMLGSGIAAAAERGQGNPGAQYTFAGIAVGAIIGAFVAGAQSNRHFEKAIQAYNKRF
jgi:hypothetical protein